VLVVDDDVDTAQTFAHLLAQLGHAVHYVTSSQMVLDVAKRIRPALIFLDIGMPGPDGWQLARLIRRERISTVFFEQLVSPKLAQTVAREAGVDTAVLNPLEGLTEEQIDEGADYFSIMRENLAALRQALGCT
jgi:CheY-like chemotaxis protein